MSNIKYNVNLGQLTAVSKWEVLTVCGYAVVESWNQAITIVE